MAGWVALASSEAAGGDAGGGVIVQLVLFLAAGLLVGATWGAYQARARGATIVLGALAAAAGAAALGIAFGGG